MIEIGKKELVYEKEVNPNKLFEEIYAAQPELAPAVNEDGKCEVHVRLFTNAKTLKLWVPEELDEDIVDALVEKHLPLEETEEGDESWHTQKF